jgi:flagellar biosynthesis protein FlhG
VEDTMTHGREGPKGIWAIGGGKGGTGKTLIASNMAVYLAKLGQRVLLVDADLGGANLHTCLGLDKPRYQLDAFFDGNQPDIADYVEETGVSNLSLLSGSLGRSGKPPRVKDMNKLKKALRHADMDYVILDVGSGTSQAVMDLFLLGELGIYVAVPEPTSIENTYRFLKEALYWILLGSVRKRSIKQAVQQAFYRREEEDFVPVPQLLGQVGQMEQQALKTVRSRINNFCVRLVLNEVRRYEDVEVGFAVRSAIHKHFGVRANFVGYINYDDRVVQCVRMRKPLLDSFPDSNAAKSIENLTHKLLTQSELALTT